MKLTDTQAEQLKAILDGSQLLNAEKHVKARAVLETLGLIQFHGWQITPRGMLALAEHKADADES